MHEQIRGDGVALALVQQPGAQCLREPFGGGGPQPLQGRERAAAQILARLRVGAQNDLDKMLVGVDRAVGGEMPSPDRTPVGRLHQRPRTGGADDGAAAAQRRQ